MNKKAIFYLQLFIVHPLLTMAFVYFVMEKWLAIYTYPTGFYFVFPIIMAVVQYLLVVKYKIYGKNSLDNRVENC